ncbi:hypothetical protein HY947_01490 [Candidatus Gottesmanbacteria bacterium]|nr:hypothetical protein [Candidatus Gottesmanbacteria bacterium]
MKYIPVVVCLLSLYIFFLPLQRTDAVIAGHDAGYHFTRLQLFANAFREGQFPVRWIEGPAEGLSHPLFQFYPPLFYYISSIFLLAGIAYVSAVYIGLVTSGAVGWVGMYWFVRKLIGHPREDSPRGEVRGNDKISVSTLAALVSASMFLFTPYRISQLYVRAAYGEFLATSLIPFVFLGILSLMEKSKNSAKKDLPFGMGVLTAVSLAAIFMSHQPTLLMVFPFVIGWIVLLWIVTQNTRGLVFAALALVFGMLLSSTFLFPLLLEQQFIRASALASNYFDFRIHFAAFSQLVYSAWGYGVSQKGPNDGMSFQVGVLNWLGTLAAFGAFLHERTIGKKSLSISIFLVSGFFLCMLLGSLFFAIDISRPLWERFSSFAFIQYPWRFLSVTSLSTSVLTGCAIHYWLGREEKNRRGYAIGTFVILVLFNIRYIAPAAFLPRNSFDLGNPELSKYNSAESPFFGIEMGYMPIFTKELSLRQSKEKAIVVLGKATLTPASIGIVRQTFDVDASDVSTIRILTHYFPGWVVKLDGKDTVPAYNNPEGFMEVTVPVGKHTLAAVLEKTQVRAVADYLSLGTLLALAGIAIFSLKRFWSKYSGAMPPALS